MRRPRPPRASRKISSADIFGAVFLELQTIDLDSQQTLGKEAVETVFSVFSHRERTLRVWICPGSYIGRRVRAISPMELSVKMQMGVPCALDPGDGVLRPSESMQFGHPQISISKQNSGAAFLGCDRYMIAHAGLEFIEDCRAECFVYSKAISWNMP